MQGCLSTYLYFESQHEEFRLSRGLEIEVINIFCGALDKEMHCRRLSSVPGDTKWNDWHVNPSTMYFAHQIFKT